MILLKLSDETDVFLPWNFSRYQMAMQYGKICRISFSFEVQHTHFSNQQIYYGLHNWLFNKTIIIQFLYKNIVAFVIGTGQ